jgi:hypothetical protein
MSVASRAIEKAIKKGFIKPKEEGEPKPLPAETPVEPSTDKGEDQDKKDQPEAGGPGPLFGGSIEEDQPILQDPGTTLEGIPSDDEIRHLKKPIAILSQYLDGKVVYLVRTEEMASEMEKQGKVAFTPDEIKKLSALFRVTNKDEWITHLKFVCHTKKLMSGSRVVEVK